MGVDPPKGLARSSPAPRIIDAICIMPRRVSGFDLLELLARKGNPKRRGGANIIWRNRSLWNISRACGPMAAYWGFSARACSRTAGFDIKEDICCKNSGEFIIVCSCVFVKLQRYLERGDGVHHIWIIWIDSHVREWVETSHKPISQMAIQLSERVVYILPCLHVWQRLRSGGLRR